MRFPVRRPFRLVALVPLAATACIHINTKGYPAVERSDVLPLVAVRDSAGGAATDTAWVLSRPPITVVGRSRATLDVPAGLTGVARGWERMFGTLPGPATVVLVDVSDRGRVGAPVALPDSLAGRTVVWVPTMRWDDGERERRMGPPMSGQAGGPPMMGGGGGGGGNAALQLAQAWLDARLAREGNAALVPAWLRAGLVETLGGNEALPMGRRGRADVPRLGLDTLLARRCPEGWSPVALWHPRAPGAPGARDVADSVLAAERRARRAREARTGESDGEREPRENVQAPCGISLRQASGSFLRYLMDRGGDPMAERVFKSYLDGGTLEQAVAGAPGLPQTTAELQRAWRAWEEERMDDVRNRRTS